MLNRYLNLTETTKKLILNNTLLTTLLLLILNVTLISILNYSLTENLDLRLTHEIEKILPTISASQEGIEILSFREFNESDFQYLTENPYFLQIYDGKGKILIQSRNLLSYKRIPLKLSAINHSLSFEFTDLGIEKLRTAYYPLKDKSNNLAAILQLSVFSRDLDIMMSRVVEINLFVFPIVILLVVISSFFIAKKSFSPINKLIFEANNISATDLEKRINIPAKSDDEIGKLRDTINSLLDRLSQHVKEVSNFSNQVSHQLMNPLTAIKSEIEYLLKKDRETKDYKTALEALSSQTDHLINIVKTLLLISKTSLGRSEIKSILNLSELLMKDISNLFKTERLVLEIEPNIFVRGDVEKFFMAVQNLISNALKYSEDKVIVTLTSDKQSAILKIADLGLGISEEEKEKVFTRFYRSERVEKLGIKGYGLGLSLVKSVVDEAKGVIQIVDNKPKGTIFIIILPLVILED